MFRLFGYYVSKTYLLLGVAEAAVSFAAFYLGADTRFGGAWPDEAPPEKVLVTALVFASVMSASLIALGLYQRGDGGEKSAGVVVRLCIGFLLGGATLTVLFYVFPWLYAGRGIMAWSLLYALLGVGLLRVLFDHLVSSEARKRRILVLGAGKNARDIEDLVCRDPGVGFTPVGYVPLPGDLPLVPEDKLIPAACPLLELAIERDIDEILVAADQRRGRLPLDDLVECKMSGYEVLDLLGFYEKELALVKIDLLHPSFIIYSAGFRVGTSMAYVKRLIDLITAMWLLLLASPMMLLVAAASLVESRGRHPIFYHQERVGHNGKIFRLHKFRSMRPDAEADGVARWASRNDPRITPLGAFLRKTRLDELPQLINVLQGDMSLVGPRPERPEFVERLRLAIPFYAERHRVKPGVTGWAQMLYPYGSSEEDAKRKLELDLYYVKHAGIVLDLVILLQTVEVVLMGKGAR